MIYLSIAYLRDFLDLRDLRDFLVFLDFFPFLAFLDFLVFLVALFVALGAEPSLFHSLLRLLASLIASLRDAWLPSFLIRFTNSNHFSPIIHSVEIIRPAVGIVNKNELLSQNE